MGLRSRLLILIAVLVSAALAASFWVINAAVRRQTLTDLDRSLKVAERVWQTLSQSQAQSLVASATGMAGEAGFVTVLRGTDPATLLDYLQDAQSNNAAIDLIVVCDGKGKARARTDQVPAPLDPQDPLLTAALEGQVGAAFWACPSGFYLAAASPILRQGGVIEGVVLLGLRLDKDFIERLAQDTATHVALVPTQGNPFTTLPGLEKHSSRALGVSVHSLDVPLVNFAGQPLGQLVLARDIDSALSYMSAVTVQLVGLGLATLLLAFLISMPLVGRMTNPVVLLEKAQAEMDAIFQGTLDGLVALDQAGRIVTSNPAAAMCLGEAWDKLPGRSLEELLPAEVFSQLIAAQPSSGQLVQRCQWLREGRQFQLTRTFVASQHAEVGSILVTRDRTHEAAQARDQMRLVSRLKTLLQHAPQGEAEGRRWERDRQNLLLLAGEMPAGEAPLESLHEELASLAAELQVPLEAGPDLPQVELTPVQLRLLLLNLAESTGFAVERQGGGCWLAARGAQLSGWELEAVQALLLPVEGRLEQTGEDTRIWLPALC